MRSQSGKLSLLIFQLPFGPRYAEVGVYLVCVCYVSHGSPPVKAHSATVAIRVVLPVYPPNAHSEFPQHYVHLPSGSPFRAYKHRHTPHPIRWFAHAPRPCSSPLHPMASRSDASTRCSLRCEPHHECACPSLPLWRTPSALRHATAATPCCCDKDKTNMRI